MPEKEKTLSVTYKGPHRAVDVPLAGGRAIRIERGKRADVPEAVAIGLSRQRTFSVPGAAAALERQKKAAGKTNPPPETESGEETETTEETGTSE